MHPFAGFVIALGVGAAVCTGQGIAHAETSDPSTEKSATSTDSSKASSEEKNTETATSASMDPAPSTVTDDSDSQTDDADRDVTGTEDEADDPTDSESPSALQPSRKARAELDVKPRLTITSDESSTETDDTDLAIDTTESSTTATLSAPEKTTEIPDASEAAAQPDAQKLISPQAKSTPEPEEPVTVVTGVVNAITDLFNPLTEDGTPGAPAGAPAAWSLLAFARREVENLFAPSSDTDSAASHSTTSQTLQEQAVVNTLTYTDPPTAIDQLIVSGLRVVRDVFHAFGLDFGGIVGKLIATQDPPFFLTFGLDAQQSQYEISPGNVWKVWTFTPPDPTGRIVVGIHGGGNIIEPNIEHWYDYTQMARDTGATVVVPIYPLATTPDGAIVKVQPVMADFISQQIHRYGAENVSIYADSAGVTYTLGALRELILRGDPVPASMVLLSGQANYSPNYNPDVYLIDDPFFDINHLEFYVDNSHAWDGITGGEDPRISPLFMETKVLQGLPPTTMYVGGVEFLLPDNLLLYQRAVDIGAPISIVVGLGMPHDWALGGLPIWSPAPKVRPDIYRQLGLLTD